jgi:hypothetical protein
MAQTVSTNRGGLLSGSGAAITWCGSCGCEGATTTKTFELGHVGAGTYSVSSIAVSGCNVKSGGQYGTYARFNGQRFVNPVDGGEWVFAQGSLSISLLEDPNPLDLVTYDCLNGGCIPQNMYNTPGVFTSLAACQSGCAKNSNCMGECVDPAEIAALQQAVGNLQSKICK